MSLAIVIMSFNVDFVMKINFIWNDQNIIIIISGRYHDLCVWGYQLYRLQDDDTGMVGNDGSTPLLQLGRLTQTTKPNLCLKNIWLQKELSASPGNVDNTPSRV